MQVSLMGRLVEKEIIDSWAAQEKCQIHNSASVACCRRNRMPCMLRVGEIVCLRQILESFWHGFGLGCAADS